MQEPYRTPPAIAQPCVGLMDRLGIGVPILSAPMAFAAGGALAAAVSRAGDWFGNPVNLAARLVAAAAPGQVLATSALRYKVPDWSAIALDPLSLKGFDDPVAAFDLRGGTLPG